MKEDKLSINESKWDKRALTYDKRIFSYFRIIQKMTISRINLADGSDVLDLGCGTGWAVNHMAEMSPYKGNYYGVDLSYRMIEKAKQNNDRRENIHFIQANAEELPFSDNFFDKIICTNSFHHYPDPVKVMNEVSRILKTHGRIYIIDVTADDLLTRWINLRVYRREPAHVRFYASKEYEHFFSVSGLKPVNHARLFLYPLKIHTAEK